MSNIYQKRKRVNGKISSSSYNKSGREKWVEGRGLNGMQNTIAPLPKKTKERIK